MFSDTHPPKRLIFFGCINFHLEAIYFFPFTILYPIPVQFSAKRTAKTCAYVRFDMQISFRAFALHVRASTHAFLSRQANKVIPVIHLNRSRKLGCKPLEATESEASRDYKLESEPREGCWKPDEPKIPFITCKALPRWPIRQIPLFKLLLAPFSGCFDVNIQWSGLPYFARVQI